MNEDFWNYLPNVSGRYLVQLEENEEVVLCDYDSYTTSFDLYEGDTVVRWMPLPSEGKTLAYEARKFIFDELDSWLDACFDDDEETHSELYVVITNFLNGDCTKSN